MGRQLAVLMGPHDREMLWHELQKLGGTALAYYHTGPVPAALNGLANLENTPMAWLVRDADLGKIRMVHIESQRYWLIDQLNSPVIELSGGRSEIDPTICGRLYYVTNHVVDGAWESYEDSFLEFGEALWRWVRMSFFRDRVMNCWLGPEARETRDSLLSTAH